MEVDVSGAKLVFERSNRLPGATSTYYTHTPPGGTRPSLFAKAVRRENAECLGCLDREARALRLLEGLDVAPRLIMEDVSRQLLVMEYAGEMVRDVTEKVASQLAEIAAKLDAVGIRHNDLKREEVLVDASGVVRVCDFGFCKVDGQWLGRDIANFRTAASDMDNPAAVARILSDAGFGSKPQCGEPPKR